MTKIKFGFWLFLILAISVPATGVIAQKIQGNKVVKKKSGVVLTVTISNIKNAKGSISVGLFNKKKGFPKGQVFRGIHIHAQVGKVTGRFSNLPLGKYAIAVYHDKNNNKKLDKNFFGIPKEPYGFSQNARAIFGSPSFAKAAFIVGKKSLSTSIKIK